MIVFIYEAQTGLMIAEYDGDYYYCPIIMNMIGTILRTDGVQYVQTGVHSLIKNGNFVISNIFFETKRNI